MAFPWQTLCLPTERMSVRLEIAHPLPGGKPAKAGCGQNCLAELPAPRLFRPVPGPACPRPARYHKHSSAELRPRREPLDRFVLPGLDGGSGGLLPARFVRARVRLPVGFPRRPSSARHFRRRRAGARPVAALGPVHVLRQSDLRQYSDSSLLSSGACCHTGLQLVRQRHASTPSGQMPLWDPYTYCGNPIYANIQTALFYPPVLAATLASNWFGNGTLPHLLAWVVAVQVCFAGWCTFALLRRLGAAPAAAFLSATVFQLGCFFTSQAEHMGAMQGGAWLPLVWWCCWELREGLRWRWLATLSLALAMTVLAGLPQVAVAAFGSAFALAVVLGLFRLGRRRLPLHVLLAWAWALLLAAVQVIPTAQLTRHSVAKFRAEWLKTGGGIKLGALYSLVMPNYWNVFDLSKFHGPAGADLTFLYLYCSLAGLALALCAALWKPDRRAGGFALFTLAAGIWMLGDSTPIGRAIFGALPIEIRIGIHPEFHLPVFALGMAVLAGLGARRFLRARPQNDRKSTR